MKITTEGFLHWPVGVRRTEIRVEGTFKTAFGAAYQDVRLKLKQLRVASATISGNMAVRADGLAHAEQRVGGDPGIAVYLKRRDGTFVVAVDRYKTKTANMRAVAHVLEALRTIERHGNAQILAQAIEGFRAIEPGRVLALPAAPWWRVLGFVERPAAIETVRLAFREFVRKGGHPDQGGDPEVYLEASAALAAAEAEFAERRAS